MNLMLLASTVTTTVTNNATAKNANPFSEAVIPIVKLVNMALGPAIAVVAALGAVWCVFLGVKLAKADEPQEKEKAKQALRNAVVGYLLIFILIVVLKLSLQPLIDWVSVSTHETLTLPSQQ